MAATMVCTADIAHRAECEARCGGCGFMRPDRRSGGRRSLKLTTAERRVMSNWVAQFSPGAGTFELPAVQVREGSPAILALPSLLVFLLITLNLLDFTLTLRALDHGVGEANPLMAGLFSLSVPVAFAFKSLVVGTGAVILWRFSHLALAFRGLVALSGCYAAVVVYHLLFQLTL